MTKTTLTGEQIVALVMAQRAARGLKLCFSVPDRETPFVCYARDEAQKAQWLKTAAARGWEAVR